MNICMKPLCLGLTVCVTITDILFNIKLFLYTIVTKEEDF